MSSPVVLKREPLDSLKAEFLIPGRKFVPGRNCGGKVVDEKNLFIVTLVFSTQKLHSQVGLD